MNLKRIFGALLTLLGIVGLIYAAVIFVNNSGGTRDTKSLVIYGILALWRECDTVSDQTQSVFSHSHI